MADKGGVKNIYTYIDNFQQIQKTYRSGKYKKTKSKYKWKMSGKNQLRHRNSQIYSSRWIEKSWFASRLEPGLAAVIATMMSHFNGKEVHLPTNCLIQKDVEEPFPTRIPVPWSRALLGRCRLYLLRMTRDQRDLSLIMEFANQFCHCYRIC